MKYWIIVMPLLLSTGYFYRPAADLNPETVCEQLSEREARQQCWAFRRTLPKGELLEPDRGAVAVLEKMPKDSLPPTARDSLQHTLYQAARRSVDTLVRAQPDPVLESVMTAEFLKAGQHSLTKLAEQLPEGDSLLKEVLRDQWYLEGLMLRRQAARARPVDTVLLRRATNSQLTALDVDYAAAHPFYELGRCFYLVQNYAQSARFFLQAAERSPDWVAPMISLSQCQFYLGEGDQGLQLAAQAIERHPDFMYGYLHLAHLLGRTEQPELSLQIVERVVERLLAAPATPYTRETLARILLTFELYPEAEAFLLDARAERPTLTNTLLLGQLYDRADYVLAADSVYRSCLAEWPEDPEAYLRQGLIYHSLGRYPLARQYYEEALLRAPDHPEVCYNLGLIESLQGNRDVAARLYERARAHGEPIYQVFDTLDALVADITGSMDVQSLLPAPGAYFRNHTFFGQFRRPAKVFEDLVYLNLADLSFEQEQQEAAIRYYQTALLYNPGQRTAYPRLIGLLMEKGDYQRAFLFSELYDVYVEASSDKREERRFIRDAGREARRQGARRLNYSQLDYYFYVLDNFWYHLYGFRELALEPDALNVQMGQRSLQKLLKK